MSHALLYSFLQPIAPQVGVRIAVAGKRWGWISGWLSRFAATGHAQAEVLMSNDRPIHKLDLPIFGQSILGQLILGNKLLGYQLAGNLPANLSGRYRHRKIFSVRN